MSKAAGGAPPTALIGRLRGIIPAATTIELVFDGPPERGLRNERIAAGLVVRYSGGRTADAVILTIIEDVRMLDGADGSAALLVVTDDRDLRHESHMRGARTARRPGSWAGSEPAGSPRRRWGTRGRARSDRLTRTAAEPDDGDPAETDRHRGSRGAGQRPRRATRARRPRRAGLIGCGREHRRRSERDLDQILESHRSSSCPIGAWSSAGCRSSSCSAS